MSGDDLSAFRAEMQRRGVYERKEPRLITRAERARRRSQRNPQTEIVEQAEQDLSSLSIKRLAWAFGCARPDSETESKLYRLLVQKVATILEARK